MSTLVDEVTAELSLADDCAAWDDPRWSQIGVTYRNLDYWTTRGYLQPLGQANPGTGYSRRWPASELDVARRMAVLIRLGFVPSAAAVLARDGEERFRVALAVLVVGEP